uniref:CACTA en-spm transposon protein n=1 Tax=Angiostrongylus cantonensis TaxID=6313 RepID=A0A0K0D1W8_ANGCA
MTSPSLREIIEAAFKAIKFQRNTLSSSKDTEDSSDRLSNHNETMDARPKSPLDSHQWDVVNRENNEDSLLKNVTNFVLYNGSNLASPEDYFADHDGSGFALSEFGDNEHGDGERLKEATASETSFLIANEVQKRNSFTDEAKALAIKPVSHFDGQFQQECECRMRGDSVNVIRRKQKPQYDTSQKCCLVENQRASPVWLARFEIAHISWQTSTFGDPLVSGTAALTRFKAEFLVSTHYTLPRRRENLTYARVIFRALPLYHVCVVITLPPPLFLLPVDVQRRVS